MKRSEFVPRGCCLINRVMSGAGSLLGHSSFAAVHPRGSLIEYKHSSVILHSTDTTVYQEPARSSHAQDGLTQAGGRTAGSHRQTDSTYSTKRRLRVAVAY